LVNSNACGAASRVIDGMVAEGKTTTARATTRYGHAAYSLAIRRDWLKDNPFAGLTKKAPAQPQAVRRLRLQQPSRTMNLWRSFVTALRHPVQRRIARTRTKQREFFPPRSEGARPLAASLPECQVLKRRFPGLAIGLLFDQEASMAAMDFGLNGRLRSFKKPRAANSADVVLGGSASRILRGRLILRR
jgi:hypothetical protein